MRLLLNISHKKLEMIMIADLNQTFMVNSKKTYRGVSHENR